MASNPQQALPWAQTLAGLFGGLVNARQQAGANPRQGFSWMPVLAGGFNGLASGLQGAAQRAEVLRQEARSTNDALGYISAMTGRTPETVKELFGGYLPKEYRNEAATAIREGLGQATVAADLGLANPSAWQAVGSGLANALLPKVQEQAANRAALGGLPRFRAAGANDAGAMGTPNEVPIPLAPTMAQVSPTLAGRAGIVGGALPETRSFSSRSKVNPIRTDQGGVGQAYQMQPLFGPGGLPTAVPGVVQPQATPNMPQGGTRVYSATPEGDSATPEGGPVTTGSTPVLSAGTSAVQPMTLYEAAASSPDVKDLMSMYTAAANATNARNAQVTQRYGTAQQVRSANERAALDFNKPTTAWIMAYGTPEQKQALQDYAEAGARSAQAMYGLDKPATRSERDSAVKDIQASMNPAEADAKIKRAVREGRLDSYAQGAELYNTSIFGQHNPLPSGGPTPNATPNNLGPSLDNLYPGFSGLGSFLPAYSGRVPSANEGSVRSTMRHNSGTKATVRRTRGGY